MYIDSALLSPVSVLLGALVGGGALTASAAQTPLAGETEQSAPHPWGSFFDQLTELVKIPEDALQEFNYGNDR